MNRVREILPNIVKMFIFSDVSFKKYGRIRLESRLIGLRGWMSSKALCQGSFWCLLRVFSINNRIHIFETKTSDKSTCTISYEQLSGKPITRKERTFINNQLCDDTFSFIHAHFHIINIERKKEHRKTGKTIFSLYSSINSCHLMVSKHIFSVQRVFIPFKK